MDASENPSAIQSGARISANALRDDLSICGKQQQMLLHDGKNAFEGKAAGSV